MTFALPGHPAGATGAALLLLRGSAAFTLLTAAVAATHYPPNPWIATALLAPVVSLVLGFGTRWSAMGGAIVVAWISLHAGGWLGALVGGAAANFIAIALLGAGAYSVDARLFGRRVIKLQD